VLLFGDKKTPEGQNFCATHATGAGNPSCECVPLIECHVEKDYDAALSSGGMAPAHAMINGLAVSFARLSQLAKIPTTISGSGPLGASQSVKVSMQIAMSIFMAFLVQIALVLPLLGLAVGLLIRIIVIWVTTAFMPFVFIGYMVNGKLGTDVGFDTNIWKEFINAAFLPVVVGIPMVIGFIMLNAVSTIPPPANMIFDMSVPILSGVKTWWALIWMFAAIGIIWVGSFTALAKSQITGKFTEKIRAFGQTVAGGVAHLPLLTPIPLPGLKNANLGTLVNGPRLLADTVRFQASGAASGSFKANLEKRFGMGAGNGGGINPLDNAASIAKNIEGNKVQTDRVLAALDKLRTASDATARKAAVVEIKNVIGGSNGLDALRKMEQIGNASTDNTLKNAINTLNIQKAILDETSDPSTP